MAHLHKISIGALVQIGKDLQAYEVLDVEINHNEQPKYKLLNISTGEHLEGLRPENELTEVDYSYRSENVKITTDGTVWGLIDYKDVRDAIEQGHEVCKLYDDDSECVINDDDDYIEMIADELPAGIIIGGYHELKADWQEACNRNNETRSFEAWLQDKAENLISI